MKELKANPLYLTALVYLCVYRIIANQGGSSSGKTFNTLYLLDDLAIVGNKGIEMEINGIKRNFNPFKHRKRLHITVVSQTMPHLKGGAINDFMTIKKDIKENWDDRNWNATDKIYKYDNGSFIEFKAMDNEGKARGPRRNVLFVNEINKGIKKSTYDQLAMRTKDKIIVDWNPSEPQHWIYDEILTEENCKLIVSTYKDNYDFLEQNIIDFIESKKDKDPEFWKVFGLGLRGNDGKGNVFQNWNQLEYNRFPNSKSIFGMDFGFTNDPTTLIEVRKQGDNMYLKEHLYVNPNDPKNKYRNGLDTKSLIYELNNLKRKGVLSSNSIIYADSAESRTIQDLRNEGFNIYAAKKGKGSIVEGIDFIKRYNVFVDLYSSNLWLEYNFYKYHEDKKSLEKDKYLNNPIDAYNHAMDAIRYACEEWRGLHSNGIAKAL